MNLFMTYRWPRTEKGPVVAAPENKLATSKRKRKKRKTEILKTINVTSVDIPVGTYFYHILS